MSLLYGLLLLVLGLIFTFGGKLPWFARLPGDIVYRKDGFTFYFPIVTCLLLSLVLTLVLWLFRR